MDASADSSLADCSIARESPEAKIGDRLKGAFVEEPGVHRVSVSMVEEIDFSSLPAEEPGRSEALADLRNQALESQRCAVAEMESMGATILYQSTAGNSFTASSEREAVWSVASRTDVRWVDLAEGAGP